ncbi:MAG TPA: hypothetical protein VD931_06100 [Baekduia sp.]|nr:hypothetical protein [Baekduia sp.]
MPKLPFKASPWMLAAEAGLAMRRRWKDLEADEQRRLRELLSKAHQLTAKEKDELRRLVAKLDMVGVGKELLPVVGKRYKRQSARTRAARR